MYDYEPPQYIYVESRYKNLLLAIVAHRNKEFEDNGDRWQRDYDGNPEEKLPPIDARLYDDDDVTATFDLQNVSSGEIFHLGTLYGRVLVKMEQKT